MKKIKEFFADLWKVIKIYHQCDGCQKCVDEYLWRQRYNALEKIWYNVKTDQELAKKRQAMAIVSPENAMQFEEDMLKWMKEVQG